MATVQRFEGPSLDEVLAQVRLALGDDAEIIEANRIKAAGVFGKDRYEVKARRAKRGQRRADRQAADAHVNPSGVNIGIGSDRAMGLDGGAPSHDEEYPSGLDDATVQAAMDHVQQVMADLERKRIVQDSASVPGPTSLVDLAEHVHDAMPPTGAGGDATVTGNGVGYGDDPSFAALLAEARANARANTPQIKMDWPELDAHATGDLGLSSDDAGTVAWEPLDWSARRVTAAPIAEVMVEPDAVDPIAEPTSSNATHTKADHLPPIEPDPEPEYGETAPWPPAQPESSSPLDHDQAESDHQEIEETHGIADPLLAAQHVHETREAPVSGPTISHPVQTQANQLPSINPEPEPESGGAEPWPPVQPEPIHQPGTPNEDPNQAVADPQPQEAEAHTQTGWVDADRVFMGVWTDEAAHEEAGWFATDTADDAVPEFVSLRNHRLVEWLSRNDLTPEALNQALEGLPRPDNLPPGPGVIIAVVGEGPLVLPLARRIATDLEADAAKVVLASEHRSHASVPDNCRISTADEAALDRRAWRRRANATLVAVDTSTSLLPDAQVWARDVLEALQPHQVIALVDAGRKAEDVARWVADLGGIDSIALSGLEETVSPHAILELGIPVARLGTQVATPGAWSALLRNRREAVE